jgi:AcrR family transcriptional regulator
MPAASLRERSKARRRAAIERAALRLFTANGYEATTINDIAAAAEVAPRTVSLYFPAKVDLVLAHVHETAQRATAALAELRAGESLFDAFTRWLREEDARTDPELRLLRAEMFAANPALRALRSVHTEEALRDAARALAEQFGLPADGHAVRIALAAVVGALDEYASIASADGDREALRSAVVTFLVAGLEALAEQEHAGGRRAP